MALVPARKAEAGISVSMRPAWSTELVPGNPGPHKRKPELKKQKQNKPTNKESLLLCRGLEFSSQHPHPLGDSQLPGIPASREPGPFLVSSDTCSHPQSPKHKLTITIK